MASATVYANATNSSTGWTSPDNGWTSNSSCASDSIAAFGTTADLIYSFSSFSLPSDATITSVDIAADWGNGGEASLGIRISKDGGSNFCSSDHGLSAGGTGCSGSTWVSANCTHSTRPTTYTEANTNDLRIKCVGSTGPISDTVYVDGVRMVITYTTTTVPGAPTWAAQPFPLASRTVSQLEVDWVAPGTGDAPTGYKLQWDTDASFPTPPTQEIDTSSTSTIYTHTGRNTGTRYYYRVRGYNAAGDGAWSTTESTYTEPAVPTGLTVVNTVAQRLDLSWNAVTVSPVGTVAYDTQWDTDSSPGGETDLGLNSTSTNVNHTIGSDDTTRWYWVRAQAPDVDGNGATEGQYTTKVSGTTWSIPDSQDLVSASSAIADSLIQITRNGTYPSGGSGNPPEGVDSWNVWRSTSSGGTYSELASGLTATTYDDWSVDGGETWYYKAKFTNLIGDSAISTTSVNATAITPEITKTSDTTIQVIARDSRQVTRTVQRAERNSRSISREAKAVKSTQVTRIVQHAVRISTQITRYVQRAERASKSITRIVEVIAKISVGISRTVFILQEFTKTSDSTIEIIREISRVSNTTIFTPDQEVTKTSDAAIFKEGFVTLDITSDSRIKLVSQEKTYLSDSRIKNTYEKSPTSDIAIFRSQFGDIQISSDARIVLEGTTVLPPIFSDSRILVLGNELTKLSDSFIVLGQEITTTSDTAIYQSQYGDITKTSDSAIFISQYGDITKLSDSTIFKSGLEITELSDTIIKRPGGYMYPFQKQEKVSDTRILALGQEINKSSFTRIKEIDNELTKLSDTLIILKPIINKTSDVFIEVPFTVSIPSRTRIKNTAETTTLSDTTIFRSQYGDITKLSDTLILREPIIDKTSDTTIVVLFEMSGIPSDTYIINIGTQIDINSDTTIFRAGYGNIEKESRSAIKGLGLEMTKLSDSTIQKTFSFTKTSDTAIRRDLPPMEATFEKSRQL